MIARAAPATGADFRRKSALKSSSRIWLAPGFGSCPQKFPLKTGCPPSHVINSWAHPARTITGVAVVKRRKFMTIMGATVAAPILPPMALATPSKALLASATTHAQSYPFVSLIGLSRRVGVSPEQAGELMAALSKKGIIGPINGTGTRPLYAMSKVFVPAEGSLIRAAQEQRKRHALKRQRPKTTAKAQSCTIEANGLWAHLRQLCLDHGMALHPRCFIGATA